MRVVWQARSEADGHAAACRETAARVQHRAFQSPLGDHVTLLAAYRQYAAVAAAKRGGWCRQLYLSAKALRAAADIHAQLEVCSS
jgi:HrpA-like RNA helicase